MKIKTIAPIRDREVRPVPALGDQRVDISTGETVTILKNCGLGYVKVQRPDLTIRKIHCYRLRKVDGPR